MARAQFIAYYRVSTDKQGRSGLALEAQECDVENCFRVGSWHLSSTHKLLKRIDGQIRYQGTGE